MSPKRDFEAMRRADATQYTAEHIERGPGRLRWLAGRMGALPPADLGGLDELWVWWTAWRTGESFDSHERATLPPRWTHFDPEDDVGLTPIEMEFIDAAAFFVAAVAQALDPSWKWELVKRKSSPFYHQPVLMDLSTGGLEVNPIHNLTVLGRQLAETAHEPAERAGSIRIPGRLRFVLRGIVGDASLPAI